MCEVAGLIERAAASKAGVLLVGETGAGRGFIARTIHACAHNGSAPFVTIDGSAILPADAERRILGTPGNGRHEGPERALNAPEAIYPGSLLHAALGGTAFFRHLEELPVRTQARLATLLRDREYLEQPGGDSVPFTARPIAAVDPDYQAHIDEGHVRPDLLRRFSESRIVVPPLRDRQEDIPGLAQSFVADACRERQLPERALDGAALAVLAAMPWHGNGHELRALLESLVATVPDDGPITLRALLGHVSLEGHNNARALLGEPLREARQRFEREYISAVVAQHHGRIPDAARSLGIQRTNLYRKLRTLRLVNPTRANGGPGSATLT